MFGQAGRISLGKRPALFRLETRHRDNHTRERRLASYRASSHGRRNKNLVNLRQDTRARQRGGALEDKDELRIFKVAPREFLIFRGDSFAFGRCLLGYFSTDYFLLTTPLTLTLSLDFAILNLAKFGWDLSKGDKHESSSFLEVDLARPPRFVEGFIVSNWAISRVAMGLGRRHNR